MAEPLPVEPELFMLPAAAFLLLAALVAAPESSGEVPAGFFMAALLPECFMSLLVPIGFLLLAMPVAEPECSGEPLGLLALAWFMALPDPAMPFLSMPAALPEASGEPCTPEPVIAEPLAPMVPDEVVPLSMPIAPLGVMPAPEPEASAEP